MWLLLAIAAITVTAPDRGSAHHTLTIDESTGIATVSIRFASDAIEPALITVTIEVPHGTRIVAVDTDDRDVRAVLAVAESTPVVDRLRLHVFPVAAWQKPRVKITLQLPGTAWPAQRPLFVPAQLRLTTGSSSWNWCGTGMRMPS